ncbi:MULTISPECIES: methylthioribulose 1-phosphate dehydratase [unclassified Oceanobacter]|jgi:methylthioribulose-1-phosphate dehydratase|uniref:methylthioribulose 1-phosphate dehydratase n=1 Tax=unclassified Oceanobacter TaxID=2620260 RepID=UPI0026E2450C|nr:MULTISPECIES: methylthioribulose 1-phosphate dehydratase [unclassified Oceanobacter]MDO6683157.1 methylthioribulose 1-phosphate dehydratase [Oceanobacter sp. 5_MG-2023]MDP2506518.1 methylthioribulose 1-phosphate dehydratase [Oceanobacter sp. 3_MG-2023]MDP2549080.1 methylthioribulose 1-phosphate dehydratase [Oceanobacter sp. 4_MG-2023]MDP2609497.1 methylthioribulose 1-phosphate dehydratase [Oceanobacter sp. 1_MG-2023]MDP2612803.1 methylthioribulose 1-phosphate dehydratase [Oceanobacter sp. 2
MALVFDPEAFRLAASDLCRYGKQLYDRDWSPATSSNYSVRLNEHGCALTSSGKHKGELTPADILAVDWQGQAWTAGKPSAETLLHTQLYQRDPAIGAVLHTHSKAAVVLSHIHPTSELILSGWELLKAFSGQTSHHCQMVIPVFDNDQDIHRLAQQVEQRMQASQQGHAYLIRGHGVYTWGQNLAECMRHLEALEHLFDYQLELKRLRQQ